MRPASRAIYIPGDPIFVQLMFDWAGAYSVQDVSVLCLGMRLNESDSLMFTVAAMAAAMVGDECG